MPACCSLSLRHSFFRSLKSPPLSSTKKSNSTNYCTGLFHTPPSKVLGKEKEKKNQLSIYEPFAWHFQTVCRTATFVMFALHYVLETTQKWLQVQRWVLYKHFLNVFVKHCFRERAWAYVDFSICGVREPMAQACWGMTVCTSVPTFPRRTLITLAKALPQRLQL